MRQDHPAVLILGHFSPQAQTEHGFAGPDHWHDVVAQFYDIPHIRYDYFPLHLYPLWVSFDRLALGKELIADCVLFFVPALICASRGFRIHAARSQSCTPSSWKNPHLSIDTSQTPC